MAVGIGYEIDFFPVSTCALDRILGPRNAVKDVTVAVTTFVLVVKEAASHPRQADINVFIRRGRTVARHGTT